MPRMFAGGVDEQEHSIERLTVVRFNPTSPFDSSVFPASNFDFQPTMRASENTASLPASIPIVSTGNGGTLPQSTYPQTYSYSNPRLGPGHPTTPWAPRGNGAIRAQYNPNAPQRSFSQTPSSSSSRLVAPLPPTQLGFPRYSPTDPRNNPFGPRHTYPQAYSSSSSLPFLPNTPLTPSGPSVTDAQYHNIDPSLRPSAFPAAASQHNPNNIPGLSHMVNQQPAMNSVQEPVADNVHSLWEGVDLAEQLEIEQAADGGSTHTEGDTDDMYGRTESPRTPTATPRQCQYPTPSPTSRQHPGNAPTEHAQRETPGSDIDTILGSERAAAIDRQLEAANLQSPTFPQDSVISRYENKSFPDIPSSCFPPPSSPRGKAKDTNFNHEVHIDDNVDDSETNTATISTVASLEDRISHLQQQRDAAQASARQNQTTFDSLETQVRGLQADVASRDTRISEIALANAESMRQMQTKIDTLEREAQGFRADVATRDTRISEIALANAESMRLKEEEVQRLQIERDELLKSQSELRTSQAEGVNTIQRQDFQIWVLKASEARKNSAIKELKESVTNLEEYKKDQTQSQNFSFASEIRPSATPTEALPITPSPNTQDLEIPRGVQYIPTISASEANVEDVQDGCGSEFRNSSIRLLQINTVTSDDTRKEDAVLNEAVEKDNFPVKPDLGDCPIKLVDETRNRYVSGVHNTESLPQWQKEFQTYANATGCYTSPSYLDEGYSSSVDEEPQYITIFDQPPNEKGRNGRTSSNWFGPSKPELLQVVKRQVEVPQYVPPPPFVFPWIPKEEEPTPTPKPTPESQPEESYFLWKLLLFLGFLLILGLVLRTIHGYWTDLSDGEQNGCVFMAVMSIIMSAILKAQLFPPT